MFQIISKGKTIVICSRCKKKGKVRIAMIPHPRTVLEALKEIESFQEEKEKEKQSMTCKDCKWCRPSKDGQNLYCFVNPPAIQFIPQKDFRGKTGIAQISVWPVVEGDCFCSNFEIAER